MNKLYLQNVVRNALAEDIGVGDLTTALVIPTGRQSAANILARERLVLAGTDAAELAFKLLDPDVRFDLKREDGAVLEPGELIAEVSGNAAAILSAERVALNLLQRMSGIATMTRRFVQQVEGLSARITDTRKTTPGLRILEKQAVRAGGGVNTGWVCTMAS